MRVVSMVVAAAAFTPVLAAAVVGSPVSKHYGPRDIARIVSPRRPPAAGSCKPTDPFFGGKAVFTTADFPEAAAWQRAIAALEHAGFVRGYQKVWSCSTAGGAAVFVFLFRGAPGAAAALGPVRSLQPCGRKLAAGLGAGSWGCLLEEGTDRQAFYGWRRGNIVLVAEALCDGCRAGEVEVARAYAGLIDARAAGKT